ncbi:MAG: ABC transporter permease [Ruminococcaceae bacterium]|nr:ABC transporter permease [Oscillospiraceae bacterium]
MDNKKRRARSIARLKETWRRFKKNKLAVFALCLLIGIICVALFRHAIVPYDLAIKTHASERLQPPSAEHWFGTDGRGRDVFARVIHGAPTSIFIGLSVSVGCLILGGLMGLAAGFFGGRFDMIIMRLADMISVMPGTLLAIVMVSVLGPSLTNMIIALVFCNIPGVARLTRSAALTISSQEYVEAARGGGASSLRNILTHAVPNASSLLIIQFTQNTATFILSAVNLSFLGLGVQPPAPEWGAMVNDAREFFRTQPYLMMFPGLAIMLTALSINLVGNGLRDALDPKMKT